MLAKCPLSFVFVVCLAGLCASCGGGPQSPRTVTAIDEERMKLPALFLTEDGQELIKPGDSGSVIVHERKLAFPAYTCKNPQCTGQGKDGRPFLFIWKDPFAYVTAEGTLGVREPPNNEDINQWIVKQGCYIEPTCPACIRTRDIAKESRETRQQFVDWCVPYVLPETEKRRKELDEEHKKRLEFMEERWNRKVDMDEYGK